MSDTENTNAVRVHAVVDQLEDGNVAVLLLGDDERTAVDVPIDMLPAGVRGGDHLVVTFSVDEKSRGRAEKRIKNLQQKLEQRGGSSGTAKFKL